MNLQDILINNQATFAYLFVLWSLVWKGLALWRAAAQKKQLGWFIIILIVNTLGILEILYYFLLCKVDYSKLFFRITKKWRKK